MAMKITEWKFVDITSKVRIMHVQHEVSRKTVKVYTML